MQYTISRVGHRFEQRMSRERHGSRSGSEELIGFLVFSYVVLQC